MIMVVWVTYIFILEIHERYFYVIYLAIENSHTRKVGKYFFLIEFNRITV